MVLSVKNFVDQMSTEAGQDEFAALTPDEQARQLEAFDSYYRCYALTYALRFKKHEAVFPILEAIKACNDKKVKENIVLERDGWFSRPIDYVKYFREATEDIISLMDELNATNELFKRAELLFMMYRSPTNIFAVSQHLRRALTLLDEDDRTKFLAPILREWKEVRFTKHHNPRIILGVIDVLSPDDKKEILMALNKTNENELMFAVLNHPSFVRGFLRAMLDLDKIDRKHILMQQNSKRNNALMLAAWLRAEAVQPIIDAMAFLDKADKTSILMETDNKGWNALMAAARYQPEALGPLLVAMSALDVADRTQILMQLTQRASNSNALMLAARYQSKAVEPLLKAMDGLADADKKSILMAKNNRGYNALVLAVKDKSKAVGLILDAMDRVFEKETDEASEGYDELLGDHRITRAGLFDAIKTLPAARQIVLLRKCLDGNTTLGRKMSGDVGILSEIKAHLEALVPSSEATATTDDESETALPEQEGVALTADQRTSVSGIQLAIDHALSCHDEPHVAALLEALRGLDENNDSERDFQSLCLDYLDLEENEALNHKQVRELKQNTLANISIMLDNAVTPSASTDASVSQQGLFSTTGLGAFKTAFDTFKAEEERSIEEDADDYFSEEDDLSPDVKS